MELFVSSVKKHFDLPLVQMTDFKTERLYGVDEFIRMDCGPYNNEGMGCVAMPRMIHLAQCPYYENLHMDTDVLVRRNVEEVFEQDFDVALTWSPKRDDVKRINSGVMFSRGKGGTDFWEACVEWNRGQGESAQRWGGDQRSVNAVAKTGEFNVLELLCEDYNWSPHRSDVEREEAAIWHFKGCSRKKWMKQHGNNY